MADYEIPKDYIKNKLDYKVINRGKCMLCGKESISTPRSKRSYLFEVLAQVDSGISFTNIIKRT